MWSWFGSSLGALVRSVHRSASVRPVAATEAAADLVKPLSSAVAAEVRWAFAPPRAWLVGVEVNLLLSLVWLGIEPLRVEGHRDWVVLVGTYFSSFILADVTTTNVLGVDAVRVTASVRLGVGLWRTLVIKNLALLAIVGLPTLMLATMLTLVTESASRLAVTVPNVVLPILSWLGIGNVVSVLLPVAYMPLVARWRNRHDVRSTLRWLAHLALPYALFYLADPVEGSPRVVVSELGRGIGGQERSMVHAALGLVIWLAGTAIAVVIARVRGVRMT